MRSSNTVLVCIFCAVVAAAIGFSAGALLTYPKRQRVNVEIEATVAAAKKDLVTDNNLLRTEIKQLLARLKKATDATREFNTEHLAASIKIYGYFSTLCDLKDTKQAALETGSNYTAEETITYTSRELEKLLMKVRDMSLPDGYFLKAVWEVLLKAVNAEYILQNLIASSLENPELSTGIEGIKKQVEEADRSMTLLCTGIVGILIDIDPALSQALR